MGTQFPNNPEMERNPIRLEEVRASFRARIAAMNMRTGELADRLGLSLSMLSCILHGRRRLTPEMEREIGIELEVYARASRAGELAADAERERASRELRGAAARQELAS